MRINVYSQELTPEVISIEKDSNTGVAYRAAQLVLHSTPLLHHPPADDDRSAVTFWLPKSESRREEMARAFERVAALFRAGGEPMSSVTQPTSSPVTSAAQLDEMLLTEVERDIVAIMEEYRRQEQSAWGVDTPGGLEHMGDVWQWFRESEASIVARVKSEGATPSPAAKLDELLRRNPKRGALRECARWLSYCVSIGWPRDQLDGLEAIWWQYHDDSGNFTRVKTEFAPPARIEDTAESAPTSEDVCCPNAKGWHWAALRVGEEILGTGPDDYYAFTPEQWTAWMVKSIAAARAEGEQAGYLRGVHAGEAKARRYAHGQSDHVSDAAIIADEIHALIEKAQV